MEESLGAAGKIWLSGNRTHTICETSQVVSGSATVMWTKSDNHGE